MPAAAKESLSRTEPRIKPYRVAEVAALLDVHPVTIYRDIDAGRLKALRVGTGKGALRILPAALNSYLSLLEVRAVLVEVA
jgi:excisionase family DNA binding protein